MIKKLRILFATILVLPAFLAVPVLAQDSSDSDSTEQTNSSQETTEMTGEQIKEKLNKRVEDYKAKQQVRLANAEKKKIQTACKASQGHVRSLGAKTNNIKENRRKVFQELGDKLDNLITKLKAKNIDTTELETARAEMQTKAEALDQEIADYQQILSDLTDLDCATDPEAFKAALESARAQREVVAASAKDLRTYVTTNLRDVLKQIKLQFAENQGATNENTNEDTSTEESEGGQN